MQKTRVGKILFLCVFLAALWALNFGITGAVKLPTGDSAIWLHGGLLLIAFGAYWIEYRFTKPDDVVINCLIVFISVSVLNSPPHAEWWTALRYFSLSLVICAFLISWHGSPANPNSNPSPFKRLAYMVVIRFGNANVIFSAVFFLALLSYFDLKNPDTKWMLGFWVVMISARYLDLESFFRWVFSQKKSAVGTVVGEITKIIEPNIVRFELLRDARCPKGSTVVFSQSGEMENDCPVAVVTGYRYTPDIVEAEALIIHSARQQGAIDCRRVASVVDLTDELISERLRENRIMQDADKLVGISRHGTNISKLFFEIIASPTPIEEGHLVSVAVSDDVIVYFQIVNGRLHEETTLESNERSFTVGEAEQLGNWNSAFQGFETFSWVVQENSPVVHVRPDDEILHRPQERIVDIGRIPNSNFPVNVNIVELVLYHSAILGVTGSGKTFLAYHLIENAAASGVKVVCLDATGDYKRYLRDPVLLRNQTAVSGFFDEPELDIGIVEFAEAGIHPIIATRRIAEAALEWCRTHRTEQEITEPVPKILLVLEEAHTLIPEWNFNPVRNLQEEVNKTAQIVLQARKYGLGFMVVTQRTANVTKSILNQCNSIFAFQAYDETGFDFMKNYMGDHYVKALPNLKRQFGVLVGKASLSERPVIGRYHDQDRQVVNQEPTVYTPPAEEEA